MSKSMKCLSVIIGILLTVSALVLALQLVMDIAAELAFPIRIVMTVANVLIALLGAGYLLTGAQKIPGGKIVKLYFIANLISEFLLLSLIGIKQGPVIGSLYALTFAGFAVLTIASDLGELKSKLIAVFITLIELFHLVSRMIEAPDLSASGLGQITRFVIVLSLLFIIWAKYKDKAARGTK